MNTPLYQIQEGELVSLIETSRGYKLKDTDTIDTFYEDPIERYGYWDSTRMNSMFGGGWVHKPYEDLDPELKLQCLLLGVT
jgi:hypothetical protein